MNHLEKDERKGKPSASNGEAYELCNARHQMEAGMADTSSSAAEEGNRIHLWLEDNTAIELSREELLLAREMDEQRDMIMDLTFPDWRENPPTLIVKEERIWYRGKRYSGKADFIAIRGFTALIVDYKCGRIPVTPARDNGQMRWNVALMDHKYSFNEVTVALIQPRCGAFSTHTYDAKAVASARRKVTSTLRKMEGANPKLRAGEKQCKYCKAKRLCPALQEKQEVIISVANVNALTSAQMSELMGVLPAVEARCKAIKDHAKALLKENHDAIPGYELTDPSSSRSIIDPLSAMSLAEHDGMLDQDYFISCCTVSITKLQKAIGEYTNMKPSEVRRRMNTVLGHTILEKKRESSVRKVADEK